MPTADASVRAASTNDAPAVGQVQALVWQEAYDGVVPPQVHAAFDPQSFAAAWRDSLRTPPEGVHRLLVACAGEQVVGFVAIGPSQDPDTGQTYLKPITDTQIKDALAAAASVGDDHIQSTSSGRVNPDAWTHGSSAQRQAWFMHGYKAQSMGQCDTFAAQDLNNPGT